jgi:hypothetical protein
VIAVNGASLLNIPSLCTPASSDPEAKKKEQVGAVVAATLEKITDIDVNKVRALIREGAKVSTTDFSIKILILTPLIQTGLISLELMLEPPS